jgi:hypothetical protein
MPANAHEPSLRREPAGQPPVARSQPVPPAAHDLAVRSVQPEILDQLSPFSPAALASRRDLRIINRLLGSRAWFADALRRERRDGEAVLEIGAGTGELGRALNRIAPGLAGLDLGPRPAGWARDAPWFQTDVLRFDGWKNFPVVVSNLFFHHFGSDDLAALGARFNAHTRVIIANDPLRERRSQVLFSLFCPLIRAHPVTRHDGQVSIVAGFRHDELPRLLQLEPTLWRWRVEATWLGGARLVAVRQP